MLPLYSSTQLLINTAHKHIGIIRFYSYGPPPPLPIFGNPGHKTKFCIDFHINILVGKCVHIYLLNNLCCLMRCFINNKVFWIIFHPSTFNRVINMYIATISTFIVLNPTFSITESVRDSVTPLTLPLFRCGSISLTDLFPHSLTHTVRFVCVYIVIHQSKIRAKCMNPKLRSKCI